MKMVLQSFTSKVYLFKKQTVATVKLFRVACFFYKKFTTIYKTRNYQQNYILKPHRKVLHEMLTDTGPSKTRLYLLVACSSLLKQQGASVAAEMLNWPAYATH